MKIIDSDSGKKFHLQRTAGLEADLQTFYGSACNHAETEVRRKVQCNGAVAFAKQCLACGRYVGQAVARANAPQNAKNWDNSLVARYDDNRKREQAELYQKHVRMQRGRAEDFDQLYNDYLRTEKWKSKRAKVLERANGLCEGCLERQAAQVHHLTYENVFDEFMFELVALCPECHERAHKRTAAQFSNAEEGNETEIEWGSDHACDSCRWSSEQGQKRWCTILDVEAAVALAADGECGPSHKLLEGLR